MFGTKGGLTGVLCDQLGRLEVGQALSARHTFATTGERLVALLATEDGTALQGDEIKVDSKSSLSLAYDLLGSTGFSSVEAFDAAGRFYLRDLWSEAKSEGGKRIVRITWGGARLYDRYKEALWEGTVSVEGDRCEVQRVQPFGGLAHSPEDQVSQIDATTISFQTRTSGDFDGMNLYFGGDSNLPRNLRIEAKLGGYVKIGDVLAGNPHMPHPRVGFEGSLDEISRVGGKSLSIGGGAELFVRAELVPEINLPKRVQGKFEVPRGQVGEERSLFIIGREWDGNKVVTSPMFIAYT